MRITGEVRGERYALNVCDKGIGISKEQIASIQAYKNAESAKGTEGEQGSGLGLFLVKQLLVKIKVPLEIESEEGKGSCFTLLLQLP